MAGLKADFIQALPDLTTQTDWVTGTSKTFALVGGKTYFINFSAQILVNSSSVSFNVRLWNATAGSAAHTLVRRGRASGDTVPVRGIAILQPIQSGFYTFRVDASSAGASNITIKSAAIALIEGASDSLWDQDLTTTTSTSTTDGADTKVSVTIPEGGGDYWLIVGSCIISSGTQQRCKVRLYNGTTAYGLPDSLIDFQAGVELPWSYHIVEGFTGERTYSLQFWSSDGTQVSARAGKIYAVRIPFDDNWDSDYVSAKTSSSSSSYEAKVTLSVTNAVVGRYLLLGDIWTDTASSTTRVFHDMTAGGSTVNVEGGMTTNSAAPDTLNSLMYVDSVGSAGTREYLLRVKSNGIVTAGRQRASLSAILLEGLTEAAATTYTPDEPGFWYRRTRHRKGPTQPVSR